MRNKGYGLALLDYCTTMVRELIAPHIGCRFIVVDSKAASVGFYEKAGFVLINSEKNKKNEHPAMFLDLHKIGFQIKEKDELAFDVLENQV